MSHSLPLLLIFGAITMPLVAGTVIITSVPDAVHEIAPLTSLDGVALAEGSQIRIGAFPGLSDDQLLDLAAQSGLAEVVTAFVPFGSPASIGQGVDGETGSFEIAVKDSGSTSSWTGETVSLLIQPAGGEFLIARFPGQIFEVETDTGLDPLLSLHLADAKLIVGGHHGTAKLTTSAAPSVGSYATWLTQFPSITDPAMKLPGADADFDGRSNLLEYATGGNPSLAGDSSPCDVTSDGEGGVWIRFKHVPGLGVIRYTLESSGDLVTPWQETEGSVEPDPEDNSLMRLRLPAPLTSAGYFRLNVRSMD